MNANVELVNICNLNLSWDDIEICADTSFSIKSNKGYLITGPYENVNVFLLKVIGGILPPPPRAPQTRILFKGKDIYESDESEIKEIKKNISFVFCEGTLISNLNVKENLLLPIQYHFPGFDRKTIIEKIKEDFDFFGIPDILEKRPAEISYYDKKKLAFIRASLQEPELLLLENPFFNLDDHDREKVVQYLDGFKKRGASLIMVSRFRQYFEPLIDVSIIIEKGEIEFKEMKGVTNEF